ncbi:MAG: hypothetical protein K2M91_04410 [Lachnospiraceae bacterium]|nr:hypothetical protein [Lachnospiraceae bacterium]
MRLELVMTGEKKTNISLIHSNSVDLNKFGQDRDVNKAAEDAVPTSTLYQTAKAFLSALKGL